MNHTSYLHTHVHTHTALNYSCMCRRISTYLHSLTCNSYVVFPFSCLNTLSGFSLPSCWCLTSAFSRRLPELIWVYSCAHVYIHLKPSQINLEKDKHKYFCSPHDAKKGLCVISHWRAFFMVMKFRNQMKKKTGTKKCVRTAAGDYPVALCSALNSGKL